ncbi:MAG: NAD(P)-binding domain-containing protein [Acidobacteriaceae bacterium]
MKIGILGSGVVAQTLAEGLARHGYEVMVGTREPEKLKEWGEGKAGVSLGSGSEAAGFGEVVVLAVKGSAAAAALRLATAGVLRGKVVIDATNPIADEPPEQGVLKFFTTYDSSLMEKLQGEFPEVRFVKAFNSVGAHNFIDPKFGGTRPTMFICGEDEAAKKTVERLMDEVGWESADMGGAIAARAIEPLCMLWCIPGFLKNEWTHAFKLLRQ